MDVDPDVVSIDVDLVVDGILVFMNVSVDVCPVVVSVDVD